MNRLYIDLSSWNACNVAVESLQGARSGSRCCRFPSRGMTSIEMGGVLLHKMCECLVVRVLKSGERVICLATGVRVGSFGEDPVELLQGPGVCSGM